MNSKIYRILSLPLLFVLYSCADTTLVDEVEPEIAEGTLVNVTLNINIEDFNVSTDSRNESAEPEQANEDENRIDNIWIFQYFHYSNGGCGYSTPIYKTITDQSELSHLEVSLAYTTLPTTIYVVANTSSTWAKTTSNFNKLDKLKEQNIALGEPPTPIDATLSLPMAGYVRKPKLEANTGVSVWVKRMYAKVKVKVEFENSNVEVSSVEFNNIAYGTRVATRMGDDASAAAEYPANYWTTRTFRPTGKTGSTEDQAEGYDYVVYVPENIQGITSSRPGANKADNVPNENAFRVVVHAVETDSEGAQVQTTYAAYPGANNYNNFNIERNCVYRVKMFVSNSYEEPEPSANCIVVPPGTTGAFWPYIRPETGGGYNFADYLDPDDPTGKKVIDRVDILWQTKDAIGDNTSGDLVWYDKTTQKIYVRGNAAGNAVIAAYNTANEIIWSWHIWVAPNDPANVASAQVYTTYDWDSSKIYGNSDASTHPRIPGYAIMPCNLGALANLPADYTNSNASTNTATFGLTYQWGRKDPFPAANSEYRENYLINQVRHPAYDNANQLITYRLSDTPGDGTIFGTLTGTYIAETFSDATDEALRYTIAHPGHFMSGTYEDYVGNTGSVYSNYIANYNMDGDWSPYHDNKLWGGLDPSDPRITKSYVAQAARSGYTTNPYAITLYDNYGDEKSIFDPCPRGWRVAPPDLWLGSTINGLNPSSYGSISYINTPQETWGGALLYLKAWRSGDTSWFPSQGIILSTGIGMRVGYCGIYHNACATNNNTTINMHIHNTKDEAKAFRVFDYDYFHCVAKSTGGPVRCVRDRK